MADASTDGIISSALLGVALSFGIIYLSPQITKRLSGSGDGLQTSYHGGSFMNSTEETAVSKGSKKLVNILGVSNAELERSLREEFTVRKSKKIQKVLGISEVDVREAVRGFEGTRSSVEEYVVQKTRKLQKVLGMNEYDVRQAVRSQPPLQLVSDYEYRRRDGGCQPEMDSPMNWFKVLDGMVIFILIAVFCYFFNFSTNGDFGRVIVGLFPREFNALGLKEYLERMSPDDPRMTGQALTDALMKLP